MQWSKKWPVSKKAGPSKGVHQKQPLVWCRRARRVSQGSIPCCFKISNQIYGSFELKAENLDGINNGGTVDALVLMCDYARVLAVCVHGERERARVCVCAVRVRSCPGGEKSPSCHEKRNGNRKKTSSLPQDFF